MTWLEAVRTGLLELGARAVYVADPRQPLPLSDAELPAVVLNVRGVAPFTGLPGSPLAIGTVPGAEDWPYDCQLTWWRVEQYALDVLVVGAPNVPWAATAPTVGGWELAQRAVTWFQGAGRDALRAAKAWVIDLGTPGRNTEMYGETALGTREVWSFEVTVGVVRQEAQRVPTIESVALTGTHHGAVEPEHTFSVP